MNAAHFLIPGDPDRRTGGTIYDRRMMAGLTAQDWRVELQRLDVTFPAPTAAALAETDAVLTALPDQALTIIDGLALGAMPEVTAVHRDRLRLVGLVHHPLALETGLDEAQRQRLYASEREALRQVRQVIVTSPSTARALIDYDVPPERCVVVLPGTDPAPLATGSNSAELVLLCAASLTPRKGHAVLLRALAQLKDRAWRLRCAGSDAHDPAIAADLWALAATLGLIDRIEWLGELESAALNAAYQQADVFVLPSFHEGYGMVLAEALARGLPMVSTTAGAIPDTVPAAAGLLVAPGDVAALAEALARVIDEPDLRERLAAGARAVRQTLPDWPTVSAQFAEVLETVLAA
ncbi:MAG TPA: glycosyltransferase family 4 protein [Candidatus Competibacteraceae bacterium]|nr:glycosyltransferase family 4 protein [Candidatus Competibacteraceae bacterium]HRZ05383.1 glycosyltransferase family 4 protein [Candidatus Competibacteraceae bacterium]HSA47621.1 glycosyltransferase family 4 protein [Candidatus Competibacteraceae bacterium]